MKMNPLTNGKWVIFFFICVSLIFSAQCVDKNFGSTEKEIISEAPLSIISPNVLVIYDSGDPYGMMCFRQTIKSFQYAKIPFVTFNLSKKTILPPLHDVAAVVVTTETVWKLVASDCKKLTEYVRSGGGLAVLRRGWNELLSPLFGVIDTEEPEAFQGQSEIVFTAEFLPGGKNLRFKKDFISNFFIQTDDSVNVIAYSDEHPIVWLNNFGKGKVIYWNTTILSHKINRGFIIRSVAAVQSAACIVLANIGIFDLDDYPNSSYNVKLEPIKSEFDMTISQFYTLQWYPDMLKLAERFGLKYTSAVVFNYNGQTTPPYKFFEWVQGEITLGGKKIKASPYAARNLADEIELGLHGYNHQSLTLQNWRTVPNMRLSISAAKTRWNIDNLGDYPFSYIPPLNIYDSTGVVALTQVFPSIKNVGALYLGRFEDGQDREFGPEPWNNNLYVIPRNTSGYILQEDYKKSMISVLNVNGIWAHFVHPDDVYPLGERYSAEELAGVNIDKISWHGEPKKNGLYYKLIEWLQTVQEYYPWLRYMTRKQAYQVMQRYDKTQIGVSIARNIAHIETNVAPSYFAFFLRAHNDIVSMKGCELIHRYKTRFGEHYIFKATRLHIELQFLNLISSKGDEKWSDD